MAPSARQLWRDMVSQGVAQYGVAVMVSQGWVSYVVFWYEKVRQLRFVLLGSVQLRYVPAVAVC